MADCTAWNPGGCVTNVIGGAVGGAVRWGVDGFADELRKGAQWVMANTVGWWLGVGSVDLDASAAPRIRSMVMFIAGLVAVCGVIWCGVRMAWTRKGGEPVWDLMTGLLRFVVFTAGGFALVQVLLRGGDAFSSFALDKAAGDSMSAKLASIGGLGGIAVPGLVIFLSIIVMLTGVAQFFLMAFREGAIVVLSGVLVLAAAGGFNPTTKNWFPKVSGWLAGLILYKPMAALTYAAAFYMVGDTGDVRMSLVGIAMMLLSIVALPVMIRFFSWAAPAGVGALSGAGGMAAAAGGIATSAMMLRAAGGGGASEQMRRIEHDLGPAIPPRPGGAGGIAAGGSGGGPDLPGPGGAGTGGPVPSPAPTAPAASGAAGGVAAGAGPVGLAMAGAAQAGQALSAAKDKTADAMGVGAEGEGP